jgi:catechol 2,3-dioxygenase-like lactoylglutathione lyase family enzyme
MKMSVGVLDHYNVSTRKLNETVQFYEDVLGFTNGPRPPFNFPGAWLYSAGHPVLHLNDISQTDAQQRPDSGVIDHVAFGSRGFNEHRRNDRPHPSQKIRRLVDGPRQNKSGDPVADPIAMSRA